MSISQFTEPNINVLFDDLTQAAVLNNKATFVGRTYCNVLFSNMDNNNAPVLLAGSEFACINILFKTDSNTNISGTPVSIAINYIYFNPANNSLFYSTSQPVYSVKGGWYNGNNRALMKFLYFGSKYLSKIILDTVTPRDFDEFISFDAVAAENIISINIDSVLSAGLYRFHLRGGDGGRGGKGGNPRYPSGGSGASGEYISGFFYISRQLKLDYYIGKTGANGEDGDGYCAAGGGGASGEDTVLMPLCLIAHGGSGGGGAGGDTGGGQGGGGGGGGGYGTGNKGGGEAGGQGGNNYYGGKGGNGINGEHNGTGGGGGSGRLGYGSRGTGNGSGVAGNAMGGGTGGSTSSGHDAEGGKNYGSSYGGGGGGYYDDPYGGEGGSGITNSSSGYIAVYKVLI